MTILLKVNNLNLVENKHHTYKDNVLQLILHDEILSASEDLRIPGTHPISLLIWNIIRLNRDLLLRIFGKFLRRKLDKELKF